MIAPGEQRRARGRADRRRVEGVVADALVRDARQRRRVDRPAVGIGQAEADVVEQDDEDVGRILRQMLWSRRAAGASSPASVGAATLADGVGGKGSIEPSPGAAGSTLEPDVDSTNATAKAAPTTLGHERIGYMTRRPYIRSSSEMSCWPDEPAHRLHYFTGSTGFSCGRPPSSMSKSGSNTVLPCAPRKAGCALIHSLGFCSRA